MKKTKNHNVLIKSALELRELKEEVELPDWKIDTPVVLCFEDKKLFATLSLEVIQKDHEFACKVISVNQFLKKEFAQHEKREEILII